MKKILTVIVVLLVAGSLALGGVVWAQGAGNGEVPPLEPVKPVRTLSGDELRVGDATAQDSPVTIVSGPGAKLPSNNIGDVTLEGWAAGEIRAVRENLEAAEVQWEYRKVETSLGSD